ncbi:T9SS type A sorting domain-containing protein [Hymenobacter cellulosilyticus]|uniref:T9SS type A sorting domain-containing protein n=1 Tax=Hymenobacter cellulosilyticus TaxID=2932248 RepID=A0A8T9Q0I3_9BACT|nr:T9SS type A sorting domain-containing protein [Hymenobacter cellulosilyticus]UOQ71286.1 T9SS type A sorting domain-containing protein [Hymenobacter cellulosilyticus]
MPDAWETARGLNPNDASDRNTLASSGYTMLETYINGITATVTATSSAAGLQLGVYPNPAQDQLLIVHPVASRTAVVEVYNFAGQRVAAFASPAGQQQTLLSLRQLAGGNYLVRYTDGQQQLTAKIIKL